MMDAKIMNDLIEIADAIHPKDFNETVADAYAFETPIGTLARDEFLALIDEAARPTGRIDRQIVDEEIMAFAAYLRAAYRTRMVINRLIAEVGQ